MARIPPSALDVTDQIGDRVPGLAIAVTDADQILSVETFGLADIANNVPMTPDTVCNWFSMTKLVTATVAMQLAEDGRLDLDAPAAEYYKPISKLRTSQAAPTITTRHLLSHSSGLANPMPMRWVHPPTEPGPDHSTFVANVLGRSYRLRFEPGSRAAYSNLGYLVLGEIIETVAGCSYESCVTARVLEPLGMSATGFTADPNRIWATPYQRRRTKLNIALPVLVPRWLLGPNTDRFRSLYHFYVDGASYGGLVGPVNDAARFLRAHLADGTIDRSGNHPNDTPDKSADNGTGNSTDESTAVFTAETARAMRTIVADGKGFHAGLGWYRRGSGPVDGFVEHLGGGAGFWNCMRLHQRDGIGVVVMGNATSYNHEPIVAAALKRALAQQE